MAFVGNIRGGLSVFRPAGASPTREPVSTAPTWHIVPNPNRGQFTVQGLAPGSELRVTDALGRMVYRGTTADVELVAPAPGLYHVEVREPSRKTPSSARFVVE